MKLSQKEVANLLGCSQALISAIEVGTRPLTSEMAYKADIHFNIDAIIKELLEGVQQ